jgi:osmotically-inducible protein OsmY
MRNPYDSDTDYERGRYSRGGNRRYYDYDRDYEQDRWQGGGPDYRGAYNRDYERWRASREGYYRPDYDQSDYDWDQNRWRAGNQSYGGMYNRDYEQDRWRAGNQSYGGMYNRDYEQDRWQGGDQGYRGRRYAMPPTSAYTEDWQVPGPFTGRGPRGYQRSDDRIREDVCDRLTQHGQIDASDIEVRVENGEVTLTGTVGSREAKRMAEDVSDSVQGVREVHNQVRVKQEQQPLQGQQGIQSRMVGQNQQSTLSQQSAEQRAVGGTEGSS